MCPPRCFACGKPTGHLHRAMKKYHAKLKKNPYKGDKKFFHDMGVTRYCCITMLISYV